ncbi:uncharacterized protein B0H18DRAFT_975035 [Fomitopsis serialis]|uniref:uncharacterized protein n=1 Tax=Fomitopsis serialis TaxID=139415 RepID=UPI0020081629|nr:uncharacterized protein B0H18DRAFT_975035 [Neoantrodia serialis]KAH9936689.1 hypothetical protein B0H18DRAFT_975035 [Neoantrodia serialis]
MGSHVSNVHGATTTIWYGAKQIKIEREIKTQEMRCPCGYSHVNSARVRVHATKEHKNSGLKTALLASRQSAQPSASSSRTRSVSPSSIESSSPTRSVSPIQNSDTPPTSHTSGRKPKASKPLPRREQIVASAKPQRTSLGMAEQRLLKPVAPRTTAMHQLSVSVPKLLTEKTQADKQSRGHASHKQAVSSHRSSILPSTSVSGASSSTSRKVSKTPATSSAAVAKGSSSSANRIKSIGKSAIVHRTTQLDAPSTGSKRPRSPQLTGTSAQPKARKVSHASEAASSSRRPAIVLPTDSSDNDSVATAELLAAFAPRLSESTHCKTCHRALELRDGRYKNCVECREKSRVYQRKYHQERQERTARVSSLLSRFETPPGVTASSASAAPARAQASSSEAGPEPVSTDDTMDVDVGVNVKVQTQKPRRAQAKASVPNVNIRRVWENVPEFQTEEAFFEAVEQSVVEWREREPGERFEFCGGYAVVAGRKDADAAIVRKICGKLVLRSAP